jgi:nitrogenase-stabilizing/protective protein
MTGTLAAFNQLTDAEQYFEFFELPYDPQTVNINRLHILKRFANAIREIDDTFPNLSEAEALNHYRAALIQSYDLFLTSNALEQKLFKVFNEKPKGVVMLSEING